MTLPGKEIELWLAGWRKTHNGGASVTFVINDEDLDYFEAATIRKGKVAGQRYAAVLVQLRDDETPDMESMPTKKEPHFPEGLCGMAVRLCKDPRFQAWAPKNVIIRSTHENMSAEDIARLAILQTCGIDSRKELDFDQSAANCFQSLIYLPYITHKEKDG